MSDHSPILLIIDPQTSSFSMNNSKLVPVLAYLQMRYSDVVLAKRRGLGPLAVPAAPHAVERTRSWFSAFGALNGLDCTGRSVHVCAPDMDYALVPTVTDFEERGVHCSVLFDLCASPSLESDPFKTFSYLQLRFGRVRLVRARDVVPKIGAGTESAVLGVKASDYVDRLLRLDGNFDELTRLLGVMMIGGLSVGLGLEAVKSLDLMNFDFPVDRSATSMNLGSPVKRSAAKRQLLVDEIDAMTSKALYLVAAESPPVGHSEWTPALLALELLERRMAVSMSWDRILQHFEANAAAGVPSPLQPAKVPASSEDTAASDSGSVSSPDKWVPFAGYAVVNRSKAPPFRVLGTEPLPAVVSVDDDAAPEEPPPPLFAPGWVALSEFHGRTKPVALMLPDGMERNLVSWSGLLYEVAKWLVDEGLLGLQDCPVRLGNSRLAIVDSVSVDDDFSCRVLSKGMYLHTKSNKRGLVENSRALLVNFGVDPGRFQVKPFTS